MSVGEGERGQSPPCQHRSEETQEHSGSGGESPGFTPQNLLGGTPGSECMFRHPQVPWGAPRRYLTVLVMEQTESTAQGCRQTSKSRSDVRFRATSQGTAQHCAKKEHSLFTDSNSHRQQSKQGPQGAREIPLPTQYQPREQPKIAMLLPGHFLPRL